jgi:chromosome segregation ATPase
MKITAVEVHNFKRIKDIRIAPDADRALILIGGKNAQGKSSLIDALTAALGGAKALPTDAVRHGAEGAQVIVELDDGMVVTRRITPTGESTLEVRDKLGSVKAPQAALDKLIAGRFLDPLAFLALPAKQQRGALMAVIPDAKRIEELDTKRARAFDRRTEVGRDLAKAEGELARLSVAEVGTFFDVAALTAEMRAMQEVQREGDKIAMVQSDRASRVAREFTARNAIAAKIEETRKETLRLEMELAAANEVLDIARDNAKAVEDQLAAAAAKWQSMAPRRIELEAAINASEKTNREYYAAKATADRRVETEATVQKLQSERTDLTKVLGVIDERKASILAAAALPVPGLSVTDDGVTLNDVPLAQASGAERLRVALALAIAAAPALDDIWVRDAALLDDDSVQLVAEHAAAAGKRVWLERVGTADPGVIVISDGKILDGV